MKYEAPKIEILKFNPASSILTASAYVTESPFESNPHVTMPDDDPFS
ncbi:MAG: hypothetical protein IJV88_04130 [Ruminococcus sp.]|nr:hypothetical protein [Ruminococcus sp.]